MFWMLGRRDVSKELARLREVEEKELESMMDQARPENSLGEVSRDFGSIPSNLERYSESAQQPLANAPALGLPERAPAAAQPPTMAQIESSPGKRWRRIGRRRSIVDGEEKEKPKIDWNCLKSSESVESAKRGTGTITWPLRRVAPQNSASPQLRRAARFPLGDSSCS